MKTHLLTVYIGAAIVAILVVTVAFIIIKESRERIKSNNLKLPDLEQMKIEEQQRLLEAKRQNTYDFELQKSMNMKDVEVTEIDEKKYIQPKDTIDPFDLIQNKKTKQTFGENEIELPEIQTQLDYKKD